MLSVHVGGDAFQYRVFISYSHKDEILVTGIAEILKKNGLKPMWDKNFAFGQGFHDQIKKFIAHSHVFLPVISHNSEPGKWVHQEIGYAMALNIPMLPIAYGQVPGEMIHQIHAIKVDDTLESCRQSLSREAIANLVQQYSSSKLATYQCADFSDDRADMMAQHANDVKSLGETAVVRQKGGLSSFHIPDNAITHPVWHERYGDMDRGHKHSLLQRAERLALEAHARTAGCKLIVNPHIQFKRYGKRARIVRLKCLLKFLNSVPDSLCQIVFHSEMEHDESITILGDWFIAESVSAVIGQGYRATIFTKHAPSMLGKIELFDREFEERLESSGWTIEDSRSRAIGEIEKIITELDKNPPS
jgi:hypothetical protein